MKLKVLKRLFVVVVGLAIFIVALKVYLLSVTRKLPWQKPVFDTRLPPEQANIGKAGVLIFSKTNGFRHKSIEAGIAAIVKAGKERRWDVCHTESGAFFNEVFLCKFKVVVFLSTTGDILTEAQQSAFELWVTNGGGYVGIHSAADTEHGWQWYDKLLGTHFKDHPIIPNGISEARIITIDSSHPATKFLPQVWNKQDEWYNYKSDVTAKDNFRVLLQLDERSYRSWINTNLLPSRRMGESHPISWIHLVGCGRMFYTGMGHTSETFTDKYAMPHIISGIEWAGNLTKE